MQPKTMNAVRKRIWAKHRGWVFTPKEFADLGPRTAVEQALSRLQRSGRIRRIARGIYEFPRVHPRIGILSPSPEAVAKAVAAKTNSQVTVSGAKAANLLGLSTQVPSQNLFLTDGRARQIKIGNQVVVMKHVAPSKMVGAGTDAGLVIQAVRSFGPNGVGELSIKSLSERLPAEVKTEIRRFASDTPAWLQPILNHLSFQEAKDMDAFAKIAATERKLYFDETASRSMLTSTAIEKDFWVCWCVKHLFALGEVPKMCFKGGTSLSKAFDLIRRFSEDVDISLDRAALGFAGERDLANPQLSGNKRKELGEELTSAIETLVKGTILPKLHSSFGAVLGKDGWAIRPSDEPDEEMTLVFNYPTAIEYKVYLRPQIKIEFGRGDQRPSQKRSIQSYVAEEFPNVFRNAVVEVPVLDCERTFWEKTTLLHAENHRPDPDKLKRYMSRHWSDVAVMSMDGRFTDEKLNLKLLGEVIEFKKIYFARGWAHYETAVPGTLSIVPNNALQSILREDYKQMAGEMFWGETLSFDEIVDRLKKLESRINSMNPAS